MMTIKRVFRTKSDIENLSKLRTAITNEVDNFDYKGVIVDKPWGYEYLAFENQHVAVWVLYLKKNHATSMHCHPSKKTSLIVLSGQVVCSTLEGWTDLSFGQGLIIEDAVFHSTKGVSEDGAFIMELESPPNKKDLVRLKDKYGRQQGYEGADQMSKELHKYEYVHFHNEDFSQTSAKTIRQCKLEIHLRNGKSDVSRHIKQKDAQLVCLLQGKLHDQKGNTVLSTGEVISIGDLKKKQKIFSFSDALYLTISHAKKRIGSKSQ